MLGWRPGRSVSGRHRLSVWRGLPPARSCHSWAQIPAKGRRASNTCMIVHDHACTESLDRPNCRHLHERSFHVGVITCQRKPQAEATASPGLRSPGRPPSMRSPEPPPLPGRSWRGARSWGFTSPSLRTWRAAPSASYTPSRTASRPCAWTRSSMSSRSSDWTWSWLQGGAAWSRHPKPRPDRARKHEAPRRAAPGRACGRLEGGSEGGHTASARGCRGVQLRAGLPGGRRRGGGHHAAALLRARGDPRARRPPAVLIGAPARGSAPHGAPQGGEDLGRRRVHPPPGRRQ